MHHPQANIALCASCIGCKNGFLELSLYNSSNISSIYTRYIFKTVISRPKFASWGLRPQTPQVRYVLVGLRFLSRAVSGAFGPARAHSSAVKVKDEEGALPPMPHSSLRLLHTILAFHVCWQFQNTFAF